MGTRGKINAIWWNIKRSLQKLLSSMWIRIANKFAKFQAKRLNRSAHIPKVLGGYFFETPGSFKTRQTDSAIHVFCGHWVCNMLIFISFTEKNLKVITVSGFIMVAVQWWNANVVCKAYCSRYKEQVTWQGLHTTTSRWTTKLYFKYCVEVFLHVIKPKLRGGFTGSPLPKLTKIFLMCPLVSVFYRPNQFNVDQFMQTFGLID